MQDYCKEKTVVQHGKDFIRLSSSRFSSEASALRDSSIADENTMPPTAESSDQSGSVLKEHDYIGLAEVSSMKAVVSKAEDGDHDLDLAQTDLRLGLGPVEDNGKDAKNAVKDALWRVKSAVDSGIPAVKMVSPANAFQPPAATRVPVQEVVPTRGINTNDSAMCLSIKNGVKRGYMEAMAESRPIIIGGAAMAKAGNGDPKHHQGGLISKGTTPKGVSMEYCNWSVSLDQAGVVHPSVKCGTRMPRAEKLVNSGDNVEENAAPPPKGAVIGWPPIRSYRKNNLARPAETFVKVNMDGRTVGRKVDLTAHSSYEGLLSALEDMFQLSCNGTLQSNGDLNLFGSEFVLTYEDKEGDWMLVGDVPWSMFVSTVRRLRIMRGSDAVNLDSGGPENLNCHAE